MIQLQLNTHFNRKKEMSCKCGCFKGTPHDQLLALIEFRRRLLGQPIYVNSGGRCKKHNDSPRVRGSKTSLHLLNSKNEFGAVDYYWRGMDALEEARWWEEQVTQNFRPGKQEWVLGGIGAYYHSEKSYDNEERHLVSDFIHIDIGPKRGAFYDRKWIRLDGDYHFLEETFRTKKFANVAHMTVQMLID